MKHPFLKFYVRDWQADPELRMCSLEARGLWIELLCIMHNAKRRGFLETPQGSPLDEDQTSRLIGAFKGDLYRCKEELLLHGVFSIEDKTGIMFCRRMVKETAKAEKCANAGKAGGGNPALLRDKENIEYQIPEARNHISLKVTYKGAHAHFVNQVISCREDFAKLRPEAVAQVIQDASENAGWETRLKEFLTDAPNVLDKPKNPLGMLRAYLNKLPRKQETKSTGRRSTI